MVVAKRRDISKNLEAGVLTRTMLNAVALGHLRDSVEKVGSLRIDFSGRYSDFESLSFRIRPAQIGSDRVIDKASLSGLKDSACVSLKHMRGDGVHRKDYFYKLATLQDDDAVIAIHNTGLVLEMD